MGYSKSLATVHSNWDLLRPLLSNQPEVIWSEPDEESAAASAYKIRECFSIARKKPRELPQLAIAASQYIINTKGTQVIARRIALSEREALQQTVRDQVPSTPPSPLPRIFPKALTFEQVVQTWLDEGPAVKFIENQLTPADLTHVVDWCKNMVPELEVGIGAKEFVIHLKGVSQ